MQSLRERYLAKVDRRGPDECWPWKDDTGSGKGYGRLSVSGARKRVCKATRVGWEVAYGEPPPDGLFVCHTCDNRACQNPAHWFLGTAGDNNRDRHAKGRSASHRGTRNGRAKLTPRKAAELRRRWCRGGISKKSLGLQYGITGTQVTRILSGESWAP